MQAAGASGGQDYGWNLWEGDLPYPPGTRRARTPRFTFPVATYGHDLGDAVIGGHVYRGAAWPKLRAFYLYGDYGSGRIWALRRAGSRFTIRQVGRTGFALSSFAEDADGELYALDLRVFGFEPGSIKPSAEAALGRVHAEDRNRVRSLIEAVVFSGKQIDEIHRVVWPDGSTHWVRGMAKAFFELSSGLRPSRLVGLAIDVSTQMETEQRLHQLNEDLQKRNFELDAERLKWQRLIEGIADEVWACDLDGKVSVVNVGSKTSVGLMDFEGRSLAETLGEIDVYYPDGSFRPNELISVDASGEGGGKNLSFLS